MKPPSAMIECRNAHIVYVCERMRPDEIEQWVAFTGTEWNPEIAAGVFINKLGPKFTVLGPDNLPAAVGGFEEVLPGVWQSWMAGTPEGWATSWRAITKGCRWLMEALLAGYARRLQTNALAHRVEAIEWYERSLGLVREGVMHALGAGGEDAIMFARVRHGQQ